MPDGGRPARGARIVRTGGALGARRRVGAAAAALHKNCATRRESDQARTGLPVGTVDGRARAERARSKGSRARSIVPSARGVWPAAPRAWMLCADLVRSHDHAAARSPMFARRSHSFAIQVICGCLAGDPLQERRQHRQKAERRHRAGGQDPVPRVVRAGPTVVVAGAGHSAAPGHVASKLDPPAGMRDQRSSFEFAASRHGGSTTGEPARRSATVRTDTAGR